MFIKTEQVKSVHKRTSKLGREHIYERFKTVAIFDCDNCQQPFQRDLGKMDHRRLSNTYYHVCPNCNPKQFAQKKAVERRIIWDLPANSDIDISRI